MWPHVCADDALETLPVVRPWLHMIVVQRKLLSIQSVELGAGGEERLEQVNQYLIYASGLAHSLLLQFNSFLESGEVQDQRLSVLAFC